MFVDLCILSNCSVLLILCNSTDFVVQEFLFAVFQCFPINIVMVGTHVCLYIHKTTYSTVALVPPMSTMYVWRGIT